LLTGAHKSHFRHWRPCPVIVNSCAQILLLKLLESTAQ
jgi:hypothetical protein